ncbi:MAG: PorT family protein [Bacteroidales bacterium]|nr:PorT family protein [Bacteroidales bacterium]NTV18139.1 PorT family protein [Bacteroidales bacterium]
MKKVILVFAFATFMFGSIFAQKNSADFREKLSFGVKAGVNLSNVYDSQGEQFNADSKLGLAAGVFVALPLGKYFGIQPEILFSQKGYKGSGSILGSDYSFSYTSNYIDVPLLLAFKPISLITIVAGPQYSFLIKDNYTFNSALINIDQEYEFENDNIRKNTLSFLGGVDFNLNRIVIGTRVGWDLQANKGDGTSETPRYKNIWYQATIGFRF